MKKVELSIEEVLKYKRSMVIDVPDEMTEEELNKILDNAERSADGVSDLPYLLKENKNVKVIKYPDSDMSSPWDVEVEIDDLDFID